MYIDKENLICDAQALTADANLTNAFDNGSSTPKIDFGAGEPMVAVLQVDVSADFTTTNETYAFSLIQSANADLSSPDTLESRTILYSDLTAGSIQFIPVPPKAVTKRYLGIAYDGGGTTPTITLTSWFTSMKFVDARRDYASGFTVS
jgi:hypothetical protein